MSMAMKETGQGGGAGSSGRLMSLDALRGFDMFWILGGDSIGHALGHAHTAGLMSVLALQLDHVAWRGFRFYDLIFPMFVFIIGVSLVFSLSKIREAGGRGAAVRRIVRRTVLLYVLGILYYGGWKDGWESVRLLGVLQRLALCYGATALLFLYFRPRGLAIWCVGILLGYWALMALVPVPGVGAGGFEEGANLANWVDAQYLPGRKWDGDHDPEGLLSTLPAIASCLLGVFAGLALRDGKRSGQGKVMVLAGAGVLAVAAGFIWGLQFPVIKKLWTSSYVLVAGGFSAMFLALFYWVIDVRGWQRWAQPFVWVGLNPITIYLLGNVLRFDDVASRVLGGPVGEMVDARVGAGWGDVMISVTGMLLAVGVCWFLHRKRVYIRL
jgi:predicted acyltransferase